MRLDLMYLIREGCVIAEHQRVDRINDSDLIRITASGLVHLQLMANPEYLAACAEDTYLSDVNLAQQIASRITARGIDGQFSRATTAKNATQLLEYLKARANERIAAPEIYLDGTEAKAVNILREAEAAIGATEIEVSKRLYVGNLPPKTTGQELRKTFSDVRLLIREPVVVQPRSSANPTKWFAIIEMVDGKNAIGAIDLPALAIAGRRLLIEESYHLSDQITGRKRTKVPRVDVTERLYVTGLASADAEESIRDLFHKHDLQPIDIYVPKQRSTGVGRGFGFVTMGSQPEAMQAIGALNGVLLNGRSLSARAAEPPTKQKARTPI